MHPGLVKKDITVTGFLHSKKQLSKGLMFARLSIGSSADPGIQVIVKNSSEESKIGDTFKNIKEHSAVSVTGVLQPKVKKPDQTGGVSESLVAEELHDTIEKRRAQLREDFEIHAEDVKVINSFPQDIIVGPAQKFGPDSRHLEIRFEPDLYKRLLFRSKLAKAVRKYLENTEQFQEIETPILFKSTPEGAREFIVPTRKPGYAYALPQSPQQYKQVLMASGVARYFQFAKCFRDEDLRADRQPEFTQVLYFSMTQFTNANGKQVDMEMSWTDGERVMQTVENLVKAIHHDQGEHWPLEFIDVSSLPKGRFPRMTYEEAMLNHGSDKPDLRILDLVNKLSSHLERS